MDPALRNKLVKTALAISITASAVYVGAPAPQPSPEVILARELGQHFESSGQHIGRPYIDKAGKGQPLTVCAGVTGPEVVANRTYTPADCERLEIKKYQQAERIAQRALVHWGAYNIWVRASFIDVAYNVPSALAPDTTLIYWANTANNLQAACLQMPRWVYGTVGGVKTRLPGLVDRRDTTRELCEEWGRDGHFSAHLLELKP